MSKYVLVVFSLLLLIYLILPGPSSVENFPPLSDSLRSTLSGDTWQVPNVIGYFSDNYRDYVTPFYKESYQQQTLFPFLPLRLNYPPEFAFTAIKDQTQSTYLEEFVYPLRDSLFVNGLEPFYPDGQSKYWGAIKFIEDGKSYDTKTTIRFYPSSLWTRVVVWFGITLSICMLWKLSRKVINS